MKKIIFLTTIILFGFNFAFAEENQIVCTMDTMQCPDGTWVSRSGPDCEFSCAPKLEDVICRDVYEPVCALPPKPQCLIDHRCKIMLPGPKTYSNICIARKDDAEILYEGECDNSKKDENVIVYKEENFKKSLKVNEKDKPLNKLSQEVKDKDVEQENSIRVVSKIQTKKLFGIFPMKIESSLVINGKSGQLIREEKPWYFFLFF